MQKGPSYKHGSKENGPLRTAHVFLAKCWLHGHGAGLTKCCSCCTTLDSWAVGEEHQSQRASKAQSPGLA